MSNSPLVSYTKISPNKNSPRNHAIDTITIHCVVGQCTAEGLGDWFSDEKCGGSSNYGIDKDGRIGMYVEEKDRSWCSSSPSNDNRAITIECASDKTQPYAINDKVYKSLIELCVDICKRNNIKQLQWKDDKSLIGQIDKQNLTIHKWFADTDCPGDYIHSRLGQIAADVNAKLAVEIQNEVGMKASEFKSLTSSDVIAKVGPLFTADQKKTGVLASVSMAQFILESGYGKTELAQAANNCFGMKKYLSGNTWEGSVWDGTSIYEKKTKEYENGKEITITASFRKYPCVEDSIADHSAYLLGATLYDEAKTPRYKGLKGETDHKKAIQIIKDGGYATDPEYVNKICDIIERWNLTQYNYVKDTPKKESWYRVRKTWDDKKSQKGAFKILEYAKKRADENPGYSVYDGEGKCVYTSKKIVEWYRVRKTWSDAPSQIGAFKNLDYAKKCADQNPGYSVYDDDGESVYTSKNTFEPYLVRVSINELNIRTGPGTNYNRTGSFTGKGTFTIVEVKPGAGSKSGWGKLKSGAGWISLDYTTKV
jgi:flagellum-specific peptidoglycan hydrolase FlgJ